MARPKQFCSQAEFARIMGYNSRGYVTQLKQAGRLVIDDKGRVDIEASKIRIAETEDPSRDDVRARHAAKREAEKPAAEQKPKKETKAKDPNAVSFSEARARKESAQAQQAEIELRKMLGELVSKADMQAAVADLVTNFRQTMENWPHNLAAELVGKDINEIRITLKHHVHDVLHNLERGITEKINQQQEQVA